MSRPEASRATLASGAAYATIWRWHVYAGLFVLPFILILSITGSIYLFKPEISVGKSGPERALKRRAPSRLTSS